MTVATNGRVTGSTTITSGETGTGALTGVIQNSGEFSGSVQYPGQPSYTLTGTLVADGSGNLSGTLIQNIDGTNYPVTFDLTKL